MENVLQEVDKFIEEQPWQQEKEDLIKRYRDMRDSGSSAGYSRERYQSEADETIRNIGQMLQTNISNPLQLGAGSTSGGEGQLGKLDDEVRSLGQFINELLGENSNIDG